MVAVGSIVENTPFSFGCSPNDFQNVDVRGKIVLMQFANDCYGGAQTNNAARAGAAGTILANYGGTGYTDPWQSIYSTPLANDLNLRGPTLDVHPINIKGDGQQHNLDDF